MPLPFLEDEFARAFPVARGTPRTPEPKPSCGVVTVDGRVPVLASTLADAMAQAGER